MVTTGPLRATTGPPIGGWRRADHIRRRNGVARDRHLDRSETLPGRVVGVSELTSVQGWRVPAPRSSTESRANRLVALLNLGVQVVGAERLVDVAEQGI